MFNQQKQGKTPKLSQVSTRMDFPGSPPKETKRALGGRKRPGTESCCSPGVTRKPSSLSDIFSHYSHVYIKKGQPRLWAQTEGARKRLIRVCMKHQLMTGTQGTSIMLLPRELQLRSHICLCIHRLPPWYFFPFLDTAHCHGAMLLVGKNTTAEHAGLHEAEEMGRKGGNKQVCPVFQGGPGSCRKLCSPFRAEKERFSSFAGRHM